MSICIPSFRSPTSVCCFWMGCNWTGWSSRPNTEHTRKTLVTPHRTKPAITVESAYSTPLSACGATPCGGSLPSDTFLSRSEGPDHAEGASTGFMVALGGVVCERYGHDGPGVCLGDGQTESEGVPSQGTRRRAATAYATIPDLTCL